MLTETDHAEEDMEPGTDLPPRGVVIRYALPWLVVGLSVTLGYLSVQPPSPQSADSPATAFSAERAAAHVDHLAREPHPMGTPAIAAVRSYIVAELEKLGLPVELQTIPAPDYYRSGSNVDVTNVIARVPGTGSGKAVALMAHYDTVPTTPGANDNSVAVATLLETAQVLLAGPPLDNDVVLLFTDGEEPAPRPGATALVRRVGSEIGLIVNLEAAGWSGASILVETSGDEGRLIIELAGAVGDPAAFAFLTEIVDLIGGIGTDFDPFRNAGIPGYHFAYLRGSPIYHTAADNVDRINLGTVQHHGSYALGIARHFGNLDISGVPGEEESIYFKVGPSFIRYPARLAVPGALLAALLFGWALVRRHRRPLAALGAVHNAGAAVAGGLAATVAGTVAWLALAALRDTPGISESYLYLVALIAVAAAVAGWVTTRLRQQDVPLVEGVVLLPVVGALVTALGLPGTSYLFVGPALAGSAALLWSPKSSPLGRLLRFAVVAVPSLVLITPAIEILFQMAQPRPGNPDSEIVTVIAAPLLLALLVIGLLLGTASDTR